MYSDILNKFSSIRIFVKDGKLAPHKPLLLLYALAELKVKSNEKIAFNESEAKVGPLIKAYGPFNAKPSVAYPYTRLANDKSGIWWVEEHEKNASGDLNLTEARDRDLRAGFTQEVLNAFRENPKLIDLVAIKLLEQNFPPSLHVDILENIGFHIGEHNLDAAIPGKRDPRFRKEVLLAYYEQCAICSYDIKMNGAPVCLEAAHIRMHAAGGPDDVVNGLSLCVLHHKLFDLGAFTLDFDLRIIVSERVVGASGRKLTDELHEKPISPPRKEKMAPAPEYLRWHHQQIFKGKLK